MVYADDKQLYMVINASDKDESISQLTLLGMSSGGWQLTS